MRGCKPQFILYLQLLIVSEKGRKIFQMTDSEAVDVFANSDVERKCSAMSQNQKLYGTPHKNGIHYRLEYKENTSKD